ncbi:hypothetical protein [Saccharospirillum impatiens]|uniref:hypothetical protein n=1 Tax=Saccharospirillum impatiens TaxID=169438 RepID=UPI0004189AEA|nr:hypothetical protein [Saccharospirillum impatiens]
MTDQPVRRDTSDDEIDIGALMARVWATKGRAMIAMLVVALAFSAFLALSYLASDKTVTYSQAYDLTFDGIANGEFPDGSPFLISDVISSTVLSRVYRENQLDTTDLTLDQLRRGLNIEPYAPDYFLIVERYRSQMSGGNRSAAELTELQQQMQSDLRTASASGILITLQLPNGALSTDQAREILRDIPNAWAERAISEKGVLELNLPIYSERIFDEARFESLDYLVGIELLLDNIELIQENITALKVEPNSTNVTDPETGYNLEDLEKAIADVAEYDLRQLVDPVKELGLARDPDFVRLFYNSRMQELQLQQRLWQQRAEVTRTVLSTYRSEGASSATGAAGSNPQASLAPQLGDAFLDRLLEVSRQGDDLAYRQQLTRQVLEYENEALDVQNEMAQIELTLESLNRAEQSNEDIQRYVDEVQERLPMVLETLRDYTRVIGRIHQQLGRQAVGTVSELVRPMGGSFAESTPRAVTSGDVKTLIALLVLTLFGAVFFSLIADLFRDRKAG